MMMATSSTHAKSQSWYYKAIVCFFSVAVVFSWVAWATFWDAGLYGDNVEQFVWVHRLQWGYYKHPPMPTWLLGGAMALIGQHSWLTNALAALCVAGTGWLTWLIARHLFDEKIAATAIVLWTLQQSFSVSAQIYNHNTVLVLFMAATVYAALRATSAGGHLAWWLMMGVGAAGAMLSKYQAGLPLLFLLIALLATNTLRLRPFVLRLLAAMAGFLFLFTPHLHWAILNHFPALGYASGALHSGDFAHRLAWVGSFFVNQIRMLLPLLLTLGASLVVYKFRKTSGPYLSAFSTAERLPQCADEIPVERSADLATVRPAANAKLQFMDASNIWMWALLWLPILVVVTISLISGSELRNHWGVQLFQFVSIWLAWQMRRSGILHFSSLIPIALAVHAIGLGYYAVKQSNPNAVQAERRADSAYPAVDLAASALAHWRLQTACPLKIVGGDFEAGLAAAFMKEFPVTYTSPRATPWVTTDDIKKNGILHVLDMNSTLPATAVAAKRWYFNQAVPPTGKYVQFAVSLPTDTCEPMR